MKRFSLIAVLIAGLACADASLAVGPSLPAVAGGPGVVSATGVRYVTRLLHAGTATELRQLAPDGTRRTATLRGGWGIQLVTINGAYAGLSANGRVLVLGDNVEPSGSLRTRSRFAVVDTTTLTLRKVITVRGDFTVDALSPRGGVIYLIHHVSSSNPTRYQVRAYDRTAGRLISRVIADKRQAGWVMAGFPVARAATASGAWVYTFYRQDHNYPFVHALDTVHGVAVCVGVPAQWSTESWIDSARLHLAAGNLELQTSYGKTVYLLDTRTFRVSKAA
jgi:hypothetical protein